MSSQIHLSSQENKQELMMKQVELEKIERSRKKSQTTSVSNSFIEMMKCYFAPILLS